MVCGLMLRNFFPPFPLHMLLMLFWVFVVFCFAVMFCFFT